MSSKTVSVPNIGCMGCVRTIQNEVKAMAGVTAVKADLPSKTVTIDWSDATNWTAIAAKLKEIDYPAAEDAGLIKPL